MNMKFPVLIHRKWLGLRRSRVCVRCLLFMVLCSLCVMTYLSLEAFRGALVDSSALGAQRYKQRRTSASELMRSDHRQVREIERTAADDDDAVGRESWNATRRKRTVLPDDCFHGLLRWVDPTCDLGTFCTQAWRQEDVLCRVFLHQAALVPSASQCKLPDHHDDTDLDNDDDDGEAASGKRAVKDRQGGKVEDEETTLVPRIAYYVLVSESCREPFFFQFLHYLSVVSVQRFLRPRAIYVLGNCVPIGYWWSRVVSDVRSVRFVHRPRPHITTDGKVKWISHLADVIRLQVLLVNGGVYVDTDMLLLRPLDPLLRFPLTMGLVDNNTGMGNALILATRGSVFLRDWYSGYKHFQPLHFHYNGMWAARRLWLEDPDSVHMESRRFYSPNWYEADLLFHKTGYDLSHSYAVHVWHRHATVPTRPEQLLALNTTLGQVFRRIYFGL